MAAASDSAVSEGDVLVDKYRVEREIGRGGMGVVMAATHLKLEEPVAIKLLLPALTEKADIVERFLREARAAAKIKSPHVVRVIDVDSLPSGVPYMVLELLDGLTLSQLSRATGPLDPATCAAYVMQACDAIGEAHQLGIVHRDLKPSNLFLARDRNGAVCVKVLDFGISKVATATGGPEITSTDQLLGSPTYMSPEQLRSSRKVDGRTDIWSLGVVLYQCTTRSSPFHADTMPQVLMRVMTDDPKPPRGLRPDIPAGLEQVILRCLAKDPDQRIATAHELADALAPFALAAPLPWPDVALDDSMPAASVRSALREVPVASAPGTDAPVEVVSRSDTHVEVQPASADVASTQDTQVGWGTTLGSSRSKARRRWLLAAGGAALIAVAGGGLVATGWLAAPTERSDPGFTSAPAAPADTASAETAGDTGAASAPVTGSSEAATPEPAQEDAGPTGSTTTPAPTATSAAPRPKPAPPPAVDPPARRVPRGTGRGSRVDPFGKSRQ